MTDSIVVDLSFSFTVILLLFLNPFCYFLCLVFPHIHLILCSNFPRFLISMVSAKLITFLRSQIFCVVMLNNRLTNSWHKKKTCLALEHQESITSTLNTTTQQAWNLSTNTVNNPSLTLLLSLILSPHLYLTREAFKKLEIMTFYSQYIYSLVLYTVNNKHLFDVNNKIHKYKTRNNNDLYLPLVSLSKFNKGAYVSGIKVFNHLPQYIKELINNQTYFKTTLKMFLYYHSFYSMNGYNYKAEDSIP